MNAESLHADTLTDVTIVLTTQWRASALGFAGDPNARTPYLDRLAGEGLWLKQAVTPHPFGVFARAALLTGRFCPGNGVSDYFDPLPEGAETLAHDFAAAGYETAFFGKWQLYERDPKAPVVGEAHARIVVPEKRRGGFGYWEGFESGFLLNDPLLHGSSLPAPTRFPGYQSDVLVERYLRFLKQRQSKSPLFSVISMDAPHPPYAAPAAGVRAPHPSDIKLLVGTPDDAEIREVAGRELSGYYAHIEATDRAIGRLVEELGSLGRWRRQLFVFTSAHGDMHGVDGKFRKGWPHEEAVRVPLLIVDGSGELRRGADHALLMGLADVGPTLLGLLGRPKQSRTADGQDLSAALRGDLAGPPLQELSMPSVPPFALQCPYRWKACRTAETTDVFPENGRPFSMPHRPVWDFEP